MAQRQFKSDDTSTWVEKYGNGSDGALTISADTTEAPIDSGCTGTSGTTSLSATNASFATGQLILIHQTRGTGAGLWELNKIASYVAGTITTSYSLINTYTGSGSLAQVRVLKQYTDVTIDSTKTYSAKAWGGTVGGILAFLANGTVTVTGTISAVGKGYAGGVGSANGATTAFSNQGESATGGGTTASAANGSGGGGSSNNNDVNKFGTGGGGGFGTAGGVGGSAFGGTPGTGGETSGNAALTDLRFGGGGGGSSYYFSGTTSRGGYGGGIILIIARNIASVNSIVATGATYTGGTGNSAYGGSGAGGAILIKSRTASLGTGVITANGGVATSASDGGAGRIHIDYGLSYTGTTTPTIDATLDATLNDAANGNFLMFF